MHVHHHSSRGKYSNYGMCDRGAPVHQINMGSREATKVLLIPLTLGWRSGSIHLIFCGGHDATHGSYQIILVGPQSASSTLGHSSSGSCLGAQYTGNHGNQHCGRGQTEKPHTHHNIPPQIHYYPDQDSLISTTSRPLIHHE